jgi:hypothetical protein
MAALAYPARSHPQSRPRRATTVAGARHYFVEVPTVGGTSTAFVPASRQRRIDAADVREATRSTPLATVVAFPSSAAIRRRFARRRIAVGVAAIAFFATVWFGSGLLAAAGSPPLDVLPGSVATAQGYRYVVQPGDTVWSIATRLQPTGDVRPLVDRLDASFGGSVLHAGETVLVP